MKIIKLTILTILILSVCIFFGRRFNDRQSEKNIEIGQQEITDPFVQNNLPRNAHVINNAEYYIAGIEKILKRWDNSRVDKISKLNTKINDLFKNEVTQEWSGLSIQDRCNLQKDVIQKIVSEKNMRHIAGLPPIDFDQFFTILDHIHLTENYRLDYLYYFNMLSGIPFIYARRFDEKTFDNLGEFPNWQKYLHQGHLKETLDRPFLEYIELDKSALSYFQLALLAVYCDHFFLFWHSAYRDETIMCKTDDIVKLFDSNEIKMENLLDTTLSTKVSGFIDSLNQVDIRPYVILENNVAHIVFYYFTYWGGLYKVDWFILREYPYSEVSFSKRKVINFESSILY